MSHLSSHFLISISISSEWQWWKSVSHFQMQNENKFKLDANFCRAEYQISVPFDTE